MITISDVLETARQLLLESEIEGCFYGNTGIIEVDEHLDTATVSDDNPCPTITFYDDALAFYYYVRAGVAKYNYTEIYANDQAWAVIEHDNFYTDNIYIQAIFVAIELLCDLPTVVGGSHA